MCGLLSQVWVPLAGTDPPTTSTQVVRLLDWYKPSHALVQTVLVTFLVYSSVGGKRGWGGVGSGKGMVQGLGW